MPLGYAFLIWILEFLIYWLFCIRQIVFKLDSFSSNLKIQASLLHPDAKCILVFFDF